MRKFGKVLGLVVLCTWAGFIGGALAIVVMALAVLQVFSEGR